ncbi:MAG: UDP-N-acetylglucosamine 1-carboxyvinyltransferase [Chloroflexi bacterium]|nr:UDP-N-acetylglucosamine 1-carboxyvinyltransferase [Chloroflexota bacterium]MBU1748310.1 UDP-N-acetylglucosamine 1-carboxyvinyltransferase [Chloroflexota bacterium]
MVEILEVRGGHRLEGVVPISGAKNAATKMLLASLLTTDTCTLENVPAIQDLVYTEHICEALGVHIEHQEAGRVLVNAANLHTCEIPLEIGQSNRLGIMAMGPLLHRFGEAHVPQLGGCRIGRRPVNFHVDGLIALGAQIEYDDGIYRARADRLHGAHLDLPYPSVMTTENLVMTATLAQGTTVIENAACEPEVLSLFEMLRQMGARIEVHEPRTVVVHGVERLHGVTFGTIPDRNEVVALAVAAAITGGDVTLTGARPADVSTFLDAMDRMGVHYELVPDGIRFCGNQPPYRMISQEIDTHPGFMTDWQSPLVALLTQSQGIGTIHETVYEDRLHYTAELNRMGANIRLSTDCLGDLPCRFKGEGYHHSAVITGPTPLYGAHVTMPDLRAGCTLVLAALCAEDVTHIEGLEHLDRGFERLDDKLRNLGASIRRLDTAQHIVTAIQQTVPVPG